MLSFEEARHRILDSLTPLPSEMISLSQGLGRILATPLNARRQLPLFDNSAMDGYAVSSADTAGATSLQPVSLPISEVIPAGRCPTRPLQRGEAMRIFTGAVMPEGADAVVIQENTTRENDNVLILQPARPRQHVRFAGEDVQVGAPILDAGFPLEPGEIAMLAAQGTLVLPACRQPRVAILPTGDELRELGQPLEPGQISNSNSHMLAAQVRRCGGIPLQQPIAPDDPAELLRCLIAAAQSADLILTCGGVSVGDFDHVQSVLQSQGQVDFWKVAIKPGKPLAFGSIQNTPLLGLPGNPVSSFVTFELFARPAILRLGGHSATDLPTIQARLTHPVRPSKEREQFLRAKVSQGATGYEVTAKSQQGSGHFTSMTGINGLLRIPRGADTLAPQSAVEVGLLSQVHHTTPNTPPTTAA